MLENINIIEDSAFNKRSGSRSGSGRPGRSAAAIDENGNFRRQPSRNWGNAVQPQTAVSVPTPELVVQPKQFAGFWQPEANGRFTMVPNQFFDEIVPNEPASVTKLVGLVIRRTLGWADANGQRCQQAQISYSEFRREMNMSNDTVASALQIALEKGYIVKVREGRMNSKEGTSVGAFYSLAWQTTTSLDITPDARSNNRTVQKARSENPTVAHSNNRTVEAGLVQSDFRRDINKESLELINKVETKHAGTQDSTFIQNQRQLDEKSQDSHSISTLTGTTSHNSQPTSIQVDISLEAEKVGDEFELQSAEPSLTVTSSDEHPDFPFQKPVLKSEKVLCADAKNISQTPASPLVALDKPAQPDKPVPDEMYKRPGSVYIQNLVRDVSRDFEDEAHAGANISQALNLWAARGCDERDFTMYLYEARKRTRANLGQSQTKRPNRMPYFFVVLRDLLKPKVCDEQKAAS